MKFINYLEGIVGVEIFPLISLLIFFAFFITLTVYIFRADKKHFNYMSDLPLDTTKNVEREDL